MNDFLDPSNPLDYSHTQPQDIPGSQPPTDLRFSAIQRLEADPIFRGRIALGAIQIELQGGTLVVSGHVPSFYVKQMLQETLRRVEGVKQIENDVLVANPSPSLPQN